MRHWIRERIDFKELQIQVRSEAHAQSLKAEPVPLNQKILGPRLQDTLIAFNILSLSEELLTPGSLSHHICFSAQFSVLPNDPSLLIKLLFLLNMVSRQYLLNGFSHVMCY